MSQLDDIAQQEGYEEDEFQGNQTFQGYDEDPNPPSAVHQCNVCNKIFVSFKGLQQHAIIHTDSKPFVCEICGRGFRFKSNMFEHRTVHTGYTPHVCPFCGKSFRLKGNMKKHMRVHVTTKEELEEAYRPYSSNRRPCSIVPENAVVIRGCAVPYYTPVKPRNIKKLQLGSSAKWVNMICRNELLPHSSIPEKLVRISLVVYRDHTVSTLFEDARSIEFEVFLCPFCKCPCAGKVSCENHIIDIHGKKVEDLVQDYFCEKCVRTFPDEEIFRQHQSYHSRVELMTRNREIECLSECPEVSIDLICYDLLNGTNQVVSSRCADMPQANNCSTTRQNDLIAAAKQAVPIQYHQVTMRENDNLVMSPSDTILADIFAITDGKTMTECSVENQLSNPNEISLTFIKAEPISDDMDNDDFGGNPNQMLPSVKQVAYNEELEDTVI